MKAAVLVFPGSNREADVAQAIELVTGRRPQMVWHGDGDFEKVARQLEGIAPYALTGAVISRDRHAIAWAQEELRFAAGNFYINDKPTGAVVGQQPFGGARASGTNDKAGAPQNLMRWTSVRSIKETFVAPTDYRYPHMAADPDAGGVSG